MRDEAYGLSRSRREVGIKDLKVLSDNHGRLNDLVRFSSPISVNLNIYDV
jgi:hypothetical protein